MKIIMFILVTLLFIAGVAKGSELMQCTSMIMSLMLWIHGDILDKIKDQS